MRYFSLTPSAATLLLLMLLPPAAKADYLGCFRETEQERNFTISPGDYNPETLASNRFLCVDNCNQLGAALAGIWLGQFCFCGNSTASMNGTLAALTVAEQCTDSDSLAVYTAHSVRFVDNAEILVNVSSAEIYSPGQVMVQSDRLDSSTIVRLTYGDEQGDASALHWSAHPASTFGAAKTWLQPGMMDIRAQILYKEGGLLGNVSKQLLSGQRLTNATLDCPTVWRTFLPMACTLHLSAGTDILTQIDWADGKLESFPMANVPWQRAGYPVATVDSGSLQQQQSGAELLISGAEFTLGGWLQSFELFASRDGNITLIIFRPNCSSGLTYCLREDACNADATCSRTVDLNRTYTSRKQNVSQAFSAAVTYRNVAVMAGYNRFVPAQEGYAGFEIFPGDRVGFHSATSDLVKASRPLPTDSADLYQSHASPPGPAELLSPDSWLISNVSHQLSAVARPFKTISFQLNKTYTVEFNYSISVWLSQRYDSSNRENLTKMVRVLEGINFTIITPRKFAFAYELTEFTLEPHTGKVVNYTWDFGDGASYSRVNVDSITHNFTQEGPSYVNVTAKTDFTTLQNRTEFIVYFRIVLTDILVQGQEFGRNSSVRPVLLHATSRNCTYSIHSWPDRAVIVASQTTNEDNFTVDPLANLGVYEVQLQCSNPASSDNRTKLLYVELPIVQFSLITKAAPKGRQFSLDYQIQSGSHPNVTITINGMMHSAVGTSGTLGPFGPFASIGNYTAHCVAKNNVSSVAMAEGIQILDEIVGANLTVEVDEVLINGTAYFTVDMSSGSGLTIKVDFGDSNSDTITTGAGESWTQPRRINHTYTSGNTYHVTANVSNLLNYTVLRLTVYVIAPLGDLSLNCSNGGGAVNTTLGFSVNALSGDEPARTSVTFNWGDGESSRFPELLTTRTYNHTYSQVGFYTVNFTAENRINSARNSCSLSIEIPITNLTFEFIPPVAVKGQPVTVIIRLDAGSNVTVLFSPGSPAPEQSHFISNALAGTRHAFNHTFSAVGHSVLRVTVRNPADTITEWRNLSIVNPIDRSTLLITKTDNLTFGTPVTFNISYTGSIADQPDGSMIEIKDESGALVDLVPFVFPVTSYRFNYSSPGYKSFKFFVYNNGSNATITVDKVGTFDSIVHLNGTIKYRMKPGSDLSNGFGSQMRTFPGRTLIVVQAEVIGFVAEYRLLIGQHPLNISSELLQIFNSTQEVFQYVHDTGEYEVYLMAWNPLSSLVYRTNITVRGTILNGRFIDREGVTKPGQVRHLDLVWEIISADTCVQVDLGLPDKKFLFGPGECLTGCLKNASNDFNFTNRLVENALNFSIQYPVRNSYNVEAMACNDFIRLHYRAVIAVSTTNCKPPVLTMKNAEYTNHANPMRALRSQVVTIECVIKELGCEATLQNVREWNISRLNETTKEVVQLIDVSKLGTFRNTILALPKHFLEIGLYLVTAKVAMNVSVTVEEFSSNLEVFLEIVHSPLVISFSEGGMSLVRKGARQTICLNPYNYSIDPDVQSSKPADQGIGDWQYHCYMRNETPPAAESKFPVQNPLTNPADLANYVPPDRGCFGAEPGYVNTSEGNFCFDGRNLRINETYVFRVRGFKGGRHGDATIQVHMVDANPVDVNVRCRSSVDCTPMATMPGYQLINPSDVIQLAGYCGPSGDGICSNNWWTVHYLDSSGWVAINPEPSLLYIEGASRTEVTVQPKLFSSVPPGIRRFRICLTAFRNSEYEGQGCILLFTNSLPTVGKCSCNGTNGTAGVTVFRINCTDFIDQDSIESYQFVLQPDTNATTIGTMIGFSKTPEFVGTFPYFELEQTVCVIATDALGGFVKHCFHTVTTSQPSSNLAEQIISDVLSGKADLISTLYKGNLLDTNKGIQSVAAVVIANSRQTIAQITGSDFVTTAGSGYDKVSVNAESMTKKLDSLSEQVRALYEQQRDRRARVMELLTQTLITMTTVTLQQIKLATATMQIISSDMDDLPRNGQLNIKNKVLEVTQALEALSDTITKQSLTDVVTNTLAAVTQTMTAASIQTRRGTLSDMDKSAQSEFHYYDTDWESSRDSFADLSPADARKGLLVETNGIVQGGVSNEVSTDGFGAIQTLVRLLNKRQTSGANPVRITTAQMSLSLSKSKPSELSGGKINVGRSVIKLPSNICNLTSAGQNCSSDGNAVSIAAIAMPTNPYAGIGTNKNPPIPTAAEIITINLLDSSGSDIPVPATGSGNEFNFVLQKDQTFDELPYVDPDPKRPMPKIPDGVEVPGTAEGPFEKNRIMYQKLILHDFNMLGDDQSVNFQLQFLNFTPSPSNKCRQFLVVGRLWQAPSLMDPGESFDWWGMIPTSTAYCYRQARPDEPDPFTFFVSNAKFKTAKARVMRTAYDWDRKINTVKFGVRELEEEEWDRYGENQRPPVPYTYNKQQFTVKYKIRIYSSSCYSITPGQRFWNSNGCVVGSRTTVLQTECMCSHLTSFAGGFIEAPNTIDWEYAFSNFDFTKNPTLFITEIMIAVFFIAVFIWARQWDKKDVEKLGVSPLPDNDPEHKYLYELVVTTGMRRNAGTESKVYFVMSGARQDTGVRAMDDKKRRILQRGCTNRFLLAVEKPLGDLTFMRLWHDNSGRGSAASWYCNTVVAVDLQTRLRYHFVVNRWFAVEEDDGSIDRVVPVAGPEELQQFGYMFSTHTKKDLTDGHLWLSIMARPPESRFTRVERVACCLLLLSLTMVTACMFYQREGPTKSTSTALNIGPFSLTPRMLFVGVITNVITFVPLFIVMELFRRSKLRSSHVNQLLSAIDGHFKAARSQKSWHITCDLEDQQPIAGERESSNAASNRGADPPASLEMLRLQENKNKQENFLSSREKSEEKKEEKSAKSPSTSKGVSASKSVTFPWWVRIIAWLIIIIGTAVSAFFTTLYGIQFGDETCKKWISSLFVSFFSSVLLSQPLKVVFVAMFLALLCKNKKGNEEEDFLAEEEEILNELGAKYGLRSSEEWLHEQESTDEDADAKRSGIEPPSSDLLQRAREQRLKEKKMYDIMREILFYIIFYILLLAVTFNFRDPNAYKMKEQMVRLFIPAEDLPETANIDGISTEDQFWNWLKEQMIPALRARPWYNGDPPLFQRGFTGDRVGRLVGYAILRQKRTKLDSCTVQPSMRFLYKHCIQGYNLINEETSSFGPNWEPLNASALAASSRSSTTNYAHEAFLYSTGSDLKSLPYMALITTYSAGGYVFQMRGSEKVVQANIDKLRRMRWLDKQTRAVFVEFAFYNPNVNLFGVGTVYFEYTGVGGMFGSYRFDAANLLSFMGSSSRVVEILCQAMFCIGLLGFIIKELRNLYRMKRAYFTNPWNNLEVFILAGCLLSIAIYVYMLIETSKLTAEFAKYGGNVYLNFQYVTFLNEYLVYLTGCIIFASTLKFNRLLRFNRRVGMLGDVIRFSARDIRQFFFMFSIVFFAFIQTFYLLFLDRLYDYHTFLYCAEQLMQIALGKFRFLDLYITEPTIGPLLFAAYTFFVIFILLNMFVVILNEAFAQVKEDVQKQQNEHEMVDFIIEKAIVMVGLGNSRFAQRYFGFSLAENEYRPHSIDEQLNVTLPDRIDVLLKYIENTYFDDVKAEVEQAQREEAAAKEAAYEARPRSKSAASSKPARRQQAEDFIVLPDTRFLFAGKDGHHSE